MRTYQRFSVCVRRHAFRRPIQKSSVLTSIGHCLAALPAGPSQQKSAISKTIVFAYRFVWVEQKYECGGPNSSLNFGGQILATSARNAPSCWPFRGAIRVSIRPVLTEELRPPAPGGKARENAHHSKTKVMHLFKIRSDAVFRSICIVCPFLLLHCVTICPIYQHASFWHIRATPTLLLFCRTQTNKARLY